MNSSPTTQPTGPDAGTLQRGVQRFDEAALRRAVAALGPGQPLQSALLDPYRRFYGFDQLLSGYDHRLQVVPVCEERVAVHYFSPVSAAPAGYVMLCHGYYDHVGLYGHVLQHLLQQHLVVVAYDQLGHGLSTGPVATISSFDKYAEATYAVWQRACADFGLDQTQAWHWVGQSMGGAVVLETLHQQAHLPHAEVVLLAPLVRPFGWWFAQMVFAVAKRTVAERPRQITRNAENAEFMQLQYADPLQARVLPVAWVQAMVDWFQRFEAYPVSTLAPKIIQGHQDRTVSWRHSSRLLGRRYPQSQWCILPEASHHLANESPQLRRRMFQWLDDRCTWPTTQPNGEKENEEC